MAVFKGSISNGYYNCRREFEFVIDDEDLENMTEEEIDEIAFESMLQGIEWDYYKVEED